MIKIDEVIPKKIAAVEVLKKVRGQILISVAGMVLIFMLALTPSQCVTDGFSVVCSMGALKMIISGLGVGTMLVALVRGLREKKTLENRYQIVK